MSVQTTGVVARIAELAKCGAYEFGIDRALATPAEHSARKLFAGWATAAGFALSQDRVGNLFARCNGKRSDATPILVGSHLDTVKTGGAYDGAYGVVAALCALELLNARGATTERPIEAVAWVGEEGSRFPLGCLGSSVFCGIVDIERALTLTDEADVTLEQALRSAEGGLLKDLDLRDSCAVAGYLELHVEQGPVLDDAGARLAIVTAIAGQRRYRVSVQGTSGHAGTVPMKKRSDALCAAAELILAIEESARATDAAVVTVGQMVVEPNGTNIIPARVTFSIDARSSEESHINAIEQALHAAIERVQRVRAVRVDVACLESRTVAPMDPNLRAALHRAIAELGERALDLSSGAGHDATCLARIVPTAMLFVPSIGGHSHVGQEQTADADLELGVRALAQSIIEVDRYLAEK